MVRLFLQVLTAISFVKTYAKSKKAQSAVASEPLQYEILYTNLCTKITAFLAVIFMRIMLLKM